jgi:HJR/Mrr/RecB family endonuclease
MGKDVLLCLSCVDEYKNQDIVREQQRLNESETRRLEKAIENDPQNADLYFRLGELLIPDPSYRRCYSSNDIGKACIEKASDAFLKAIALGLSNPISRGRAYHNLATWKEMTPIGDFTPLGKRYLNNAIREFRLALSSDPDNVEILEQLVSVYSHPKLGKLDEQAEIQAHLEEAKIRKKLGSTLNSIGSHTNRSEKGISFEQKCLKLIQSMGFRAHSTKNAADGGIDIIAFSNQPLVAGKYVVQCKNWNKPVGEPIVRDLYGVVAAENANNGILISSSGFTSSAISFAVGKRLQLIDGDQLDQLSLSHQGKDIDQAQSA